VSDTKSVRAGRASGWWAACSVGLATAILLYATGRALTESYGEAFFAIAYFVGFATGIASPNRPWRNVTLVLLVALGLSIVTLREGVICVIFALPVIIPLTFLGTACGWLLRRWLRDRRARQAAGALSVAVAIGWQAIEGTADDPAKHPMHRVASSVDVNAPAQAVFDALTEASVNLDQGFPWFIEIGLPVPKRMRVEEPRLGGKITFVQSTGVVHGRITRWDPPRSFVFGIERYVLSDLPFHITRLGRSPDYGFRSERVEDWLTIREMTYTVEPIDERSSRLSRRVEWQRHLRPDFYFGWLQPFVMERGQQRLLQIIRTNIEARPTSASRRVAAGTPP